MTDRTVDVVVVGLGLIGSGAVRHLAVAGVDVVGIGPGEPADRATHTGAFASHHDSGRITRKLDRRLEWAVLAVRAIAEYPKIAADGGIEFHEPVGTVFASTPERVALLDGVGRQVGADHRVLGSAADGLPTTPDGRVLVADGRLALPAGTTVIDEPGPAGFIDPRRMLRAQHAAAEAHGAHLVRAEVADVVSVGDRWRVTATDATTVEAPLVLIAAGAHTDELGPAAGRFAGVVRSEVVITATLDADEQARLAGTPSVLAHLDHHPLFADLYQVPPTAYPDGTIRLKLGATLTEPHVLDTGAARRAWMRGDDHERLAGPLRELVEDLVPGIRAMAWTTAPCLITDTPSGVPTVDHLAPGLVLAAGGNGYAAKSADAIGALAATLLQAGTWTDPDLTPEPFALPSR